MTTLSDIPNGAAAARLARRAQAVARLRHPNLVRMLQLPGGAGLAPVLGSAHRLSDFTLPSGTFKRFDLEQVVRLLIDVLSGVAALHEVVVDEESFVHGAVAPQHIYIDEHGTARLVPLLPAHLSANAKMERTGYVAPEGLRGQPATVQSDVFSVGVMLWEALSGIRLCPDGAEYALDPARKPPAIRLSPRLKWAEPLCAIAERAVAFDPARRFQTALELSRAIEQVAATELSRVDSDAWQEEAPTPVFQPRLHLSTLRTFSPPPTVLSVASPPSNSEPLSSARPQGAPPSKPSLRRLQFGALALAALSAVLLAAPPSHVRRLAASGTFPAPAAPSPAPKKAAPASPIPSSAATPSSAAIPSTAPPAEAVPAASASVPSSPASAPSAASAPKVAPPVKATAKKAPPKPRLQRDDYGI